MIYTMLVGIYGPMKSGKSAELNARVTPYLHARDTDVLFIQPESNVRDGGIIKSRMGSYAAATVVRSLSEIEQPFDVVGIDEVHMFKKRDVGIIRNWLHDDRDVFLSGLDLDYRGKMIPIVQRLFELRHDELIMKTAICDECADRHRPAHFSQILRNNVPLLGGLPPVVPEDGTYEYQARCRECFVIEQ